MVTSARDWLPPETTEPSVQMYFWLWEQEAVLHIFWLQDFSCHKTFTVSKGALAPWLLPPLAVQPVEGSAEKGQNPSGPGCVSQVVFPLVCYSLPEMHINPRYNGIDSYNQQGEIFSTEYEQK